MSEQTENDQDATSRTAPAMSADQVFGATEYFELDSASVGARFAIWVTTSPTYAQDEEATYPALYVTDGNYSVGQTAPLAVMQGDPALPIAPYLQVTVGYAGADAQDWSRVRNRDLVPPGEPVPPAMRGSLDLAVEKGLMTRADADAYLADLANTRADAFLAFLTDELHPEISRRYRVAEEGHGLFGYSYGGLFSLYALLTGCSLFTAYGAGSPGVASLDSTALALAEKPLDLTGKRLHLTINGPEMTGELAIYRTIGRGFTALVDTLRSAESGLALTTQVLGETHLTGLQPAFLSFMRTCWSSPA
ncbi:alpha/beta hydrolase [Nocardioides nitrophenolicus]|uniref:alpha/beta hydrolase n=1 Tax=Nocardioides nitrophenolicus TaxID=60489 RepID=UPI001EF785F0|nr:alpha/beta hydrolase-fold protein [Nocardioides nitrophenolicus]MBM7517097.1 putative alpha/beta superfamily hydrolase [Nocardioides nitrophenolicus]